MARARLTIDLDADRRQLARARRALRARRRDRRRRQGRRLRPRRRPRRAGPRRRRRPHLLRRHSPRKAPRCAQALGPGPAIHVFAGLMPGDAAALSPTTTSCPCLNSAAASRRLRAQNSAGDPCALQLDSGMNRLGLDAAELAASADLLPRLAPVLAISHLACADEPAHPLNRRAGRGLRRPARRGCPALRLSLAATGGILLGPDFHFDLTRPGIGLYGGLPFAGRPPGRHPLAAGRSRSASVAPGETVGYGAAWTAARPAASPPSPPATPTACTARSAAGTVSLYAGETPCPLVGRVSMDLHHRRRHRPRARSPTTSKSSTPARPSTTSPRAAGTIGYEILTSLGARYERVYKGRPAAAGRRMILLRLASAFLASIGRSTLGLLGATGRLTLFAAHGAIPSRPPALLSGRARPPAARGSATSRCRSSA